MSLDQMKKMLALVESCSCESNKEELDGVAEDTNADTDYGKQILSYFGDIYEHGDAGLDHLDKNAPVWTELFNDEQYDYELERIVKEAPPELLKQAAAELKAVAEELRRGLNEELDLDAFMESIREMVGGRLDEYSAEKLRKAQASATNQAAAAGSMPGTDDEIKNYDAVKADRKRQADKFGKAAQDKEHQEKLATVASPAMLRRLGIKSSKPKTVSTNKEGPKFLEDVEQLDELNADTYLNAYKARDAQRAAQAKRFMATSSYGDVIPPSITAIANTADKLRKTYDRRKSDADDFQQQVDAVQGMSPAAVRKFGMTPKKKFTKANNKVVPDMRQNRPTAPAVTEYVEQLDELGDTFWGRMKLRALARRADKTDPGQDVDKRFNDTDASGQYRGRDAFNSQYRDSEERLSNVANAARERIANKGTDTAAIQRRNAQADLYQNTHDSSDHQFMRDKLNIDDPDYRVARFAKVAPMRPGQYGVSQRNTFRGDVPKPVKEDLDRPIMIDGKEVDRGSIEFNLDTLDAPDFADPHITSAEFKDGTPLSDAQLEQLSGDEYGDVIYHLADMSLRESEDTEFQSFMETLSYVMKR